MFIDVPLGGIWCDTGIGVRRLDVLAFHHGGLPFLEAEEVGLAGDLSRRVSRFCNKVFGDRETHLVVASAHEG